MWNQLAHNILRFRLYLIILVAGITGFMGYHASFIEMSYDLASVVPEKDPEMQYLKSFRELFGEDGNIIALGIQDSALYELDNFQKFRERS